MTELKVNIARFSEAGIKPTNEDAVGDHIPTASYALESKGIALALADGVSTAEAGKEASHTAIERFIEEYFQTPDTWSVSRSVGKILSTINLRLYRKSHEFVQDNKGFLCTFCGVIIKSHIAHIVHVGDSRIYRFNEGKLTQLTEDHVAKIDENRTCLSRAMGMDNQLNVDYSKVELQIGDKLLLTSDGVHDFMSHEELEALVASNEPVDNIVQHIQAKAEQNETDDNLSAVLAEIVDLPKTNLEDYSAQLTRLPFPPELKPGMKLDGFRVEKELFASSRSQLYLVTDTESGNRCVMKTPSRNFEDDISYIDRFVQEEWIGSRINNPYVTQVLSTERAKTALYYVMEFIEGVGLDTWIEEHQPPSPKASIAIVKQIAEGLKAFHDNEAIHQDLKPGNVLIQRNGNVKIVDFGSVYVAGLAEIQRPIDHQGALGTASYSDPQYLMGNNPGIQGDVYALATIVYELFCGHLPYGSKVEECRNAFDYDHLRYRPASTFNAVIPRWFDGALEKGVSFELEERYSTIDEFMQDLTHPNPDFLKTDPVIEKNTNSLLFWKLLSGFWFATFLVVIYLFTTIE